VLEQIFHNTTDQNSCVLTRFGEKVAAVHHRIVDISSNDRVTCNTEPLTLMQFMFTQEDTIIMKKLSIYGIYFGYSKKNYFGYLRKWIKLKGWVEELSNFTYLVFVGIALFRLCVFKSVSVILLCVLKKEHYMWIFQKVSSLYYSVIILTRLSSALGALTGLLKLLVVIESYDVHSWVEELSNFTYTARQQR